MLSSGASNHDTDLARFLKTTRLSPKDVRAGDIVVTDYGTYHVHKTEPAPYQGKTGHTLSDIDRNSTWISDDATVTIIDRSCLR